MNWLEVDCFDCLGTGGELGHEDVCSAGGGCVCEGIPLACRTCGGTGKLTAVFDLRALPLLGERGPWHRAAA
jgi:hypothetical protein